MAHTYTQVYKAIAVNVSPAALAAALAASPRDVNAEKMIGVVNTSDVTAIAGVHITRTIVSHDITPGPGVQIPIFISGTSRRDAQQGQYTSQFGAALTSPVTTIPVVMT
jgi:hypothetical protein